MTDNEENLAERLDRLFNEAVTAKRFRSRAQILKEVGLSSGYFSELRSRIAKNGSATLNHETAKKIAKVLQIELHQVIEDDPEPSTPDRFPDRQWAIVAARALQYPESAIHVILTEDPGSDPGRLYWFHRIVTESERISPAAKPAR